MITYPIIFFSTNLQEIREAEQEWFLPGDPTLGPSGRIREFAEFGITVEGIYYSLDRVIYPHDYAGNFNARDTSQFGVTVTGGYSRVAFNVYDNANIGIDFSGESFAYAGVIDSGSFGVTFSGIYSVGEPVNPLLYWEEPDELVNLKQKRTQTYFDL